MLIILEAPDGVGKTYLANRLADHIKSLHPADDVFILHKGPPTQHPLDEYVTPLLEYMPNGQQHIICDRWHIGELIYPETLGRTSEMDAGVFEYIELFLKSKGALLVLPTRNHGDVFESFAKRGDDLISSIDFMNVFTKYSFVHTKTKLQKMRMFLDFTTDSQDVHHIVETAQGIDDNFNREINSLTTYVGDPSPHVLLLGDVRHGDWSRTRSPAFGPYPATSGQYLMNTIAKHMTNGKATYGIANACDGDDIHNLIKYLAPRMIVTLGNHAHVMLQHHNFKHGAVLHPQFVRRFLNAHDEWYSRTISMAAKNQEDYRAWRPV